MILTVISHTEHFFDEEGKVVGWGPTVRELDHLTDIFDKIYHVAFLYKNEKAPPSALPYNSGKVEFVPLRPTGGKALSDKWSTIKMIPATIRTVKKHIDKSDVFQFRAPTGMGVYLIPWLNLFVRKKGWYKYAGNWMQENAPPGYRVQRFWLKYFNKRIVTINGRWKEQKPNFLSFENPCLTEEELREGRKILDNKKYEKPFVGCFVGRIEEAKGVGRIMAYLEQGGKEVFDIFHFVGDGIERPRFEKMALGIQGVKVFFHGALPKPQVNEIYKRSHFLFLPSDSEGFPKVIAEAANYGSIPVVSDVSSIGQYVNSRNGFVWPIQKSISFVDWMCDLSFDPLRLRDIALRARLLAEMFDYKRYNNRILEDILYAQQNKS